MNSTEIEQLLNLPHPTAPRLPALRTPAEIVTALQSGAYWRTDRYGDTVWSCLVWPDGRWTQGVTWAGADMEGSLTELLEEVHDSGTGTKLYRLRPPRVDREDVEFGALPQEGPTAAEVVLGTVPLDLLVNTAVEVVPVLLEAGAEAVSQIGEALADIGSGLVELTDSFDFTLD